MLIASDDLEDPSQVPIPIPTFMKILEFHYSLGNGTWKVLIQIPHFLGQIYCIRRCYLWGWQKEN